MAFTISAEAANKAIQYSSEAIQALAANMNTMDTVVNSNFSGLQDPSFRRYIELSEQMQGMLREVGTKIEAVQEYCQKVIRWIQEYGET